MISCRLGLNRQLTTVMINMLDIPSREVPYIDFSYEFCDAWH